MRIVSYNTNGIRAAIKKGLVDWLSTNVADIVCIQETKASAGDVDAKQFEALGYKGYWFSAKKKGYSGVAVFTKQEPLKVVYGNGNEMSDNEGRSIALYFEKFVLINCYFPSGTSGDERQNYKYVWLNELMQYIQTVKQEQPNIVLCGDYNICHTEIDIHDPKGNKNNSGFLPEEREWFSQFLASGFIDSFRYLHPQTTGAYSWWSQRFPSVRLQNKGWRIDYICVTTPMQKLIKQATIFPDAKHSDHCPVCVELGV